MTTPVPNQAEAGYDTVAINDMPRPWRRVDTGPVPAITLVVQGDDFGMCHAVNEGIVAALTDGILTQATSMPACPWFDEAAALARRHRIPSGVHTTLTSEWDFLRWRPLTDGPSLRRDDGTFHASVAAAREHIDKEQAITEALAQIGRARACGIEPTHVDCHMGVVRASVYAAAATETGLQFLYPPVEPSFHFDSILQMSPHEAGGKTAALVEHLERLPPGVHLVVAHPGVASSELASLTSPDKFDYPWAQDYRASDLAALTDPDVRHTIERRTIRLAAVPGLA